MIQEDILVSIITPCYNSEKTIERTFESLIKQTYQNIEYIVVDGGSKDKTLDIIKAYQAKFPFSFKYVSEADEGIYDAMNKGIGMSSGALIGIINSDDYYEMDAIENIVASYQNEKYCILYGFLRCLKAGNETGIYLNHHSQLRYDMITHPTCFVTKKLYMDLGGYDIRYKSAADYEFMVRIYQKCPECFRPVYKLISNFEMGGSSSTQIGVRETIRIRYEYGYISGFRCFIQICVSYITEIVQKIKRCRFVS